MERGRPRARYHKVRLALAAASLLLLAYVLPVDRVVLQLAKQHEALPPLRVEAKLEGIGDSWPERVTFELHPQYGFRLESDRGQRWLFQADGGLVGSLLPPPPWIPDLRLLTLADPELLAELVTATGLDPESSELARCGEFDCFVLGGRTATAQLWVEKDRFEILELVDTQGSRTRYGGYREWSKVRFPAAIEILDAYGSVGRLQIENVKTASSLRGEDFSPLWVHSPEASHE